MNITIFYRNWKIDATDRTATGTKNDGSQERFECYEQACFTEALRMAKAKVDWNEGPQIWDMEYTDGALK